MAHYATPQGAVAPAPTNPSHQRKPTLSKTAKRVRDAIMRALPLEDRLLVVLWYAERLSPKEIALVLGVPETQVTRAHDRILSQLHTAAA